MNKEQLSGKWDQVKGKVKEIYGDLTDQELEYYPSGKKDQFFGAVKEKYGIAKEKAEEQMTKIESDCGCGSTTGSCNSTNSSKDSSNRAA